MKKMTQRAIRQMIADGIATELTTEDRELYGKLTKVAYSLGVYGLNGAVFEDWKTGEKYAIAGRNELLFFYA